MRKGHANQAIMKNEAACRGGGLPIVGGKAEDEMNNNREKERDEPVAVI